MVAGVSWTRDQILHAGWQENYGDFESPSHREQWDQKALADRWPSNRRPFWRALDPKHATVLEKLGADLVALPSRDMGYRLAERLRDNAGSDRQLLCGDYQMAQIRLGPPLHGRTLAESSLRERYGVNVVLLTRPGPIEKTTVLEPVPGLRMALHDALFVSGVREKINKFEKECGLPE